MSPKRKRRREAETHAKQASSSHPSAAERYAAFKAEQKVSRSVRHRWVSSLSFTPDSFQIEAMDALEEGSSVLVAAPTGAGKTVVGEFATFLARHRHKRSFYTTPIKALSNQKYFDFVRQFGAESVGLLTGDTSINPTADIIVMTTEVLRNMIYADADLDSLDSVILDEVHYLADRFRGPVWEEVIIHLPQRITIVALSATVSNAEEFGSWIQEVRGSCKVIVSESRPVPLYQHMMVGDELFDVYAPSASGGVQTLKLNPALVAATSSRSHHGRGGRNWSSARTHGPSLESRPSTLVTLDRAHLLPAITFIFSRAGCDDAVSQILRSGIVLTSQSEARQIRDYVEEATSVIAPEDFAVLGLNRWIRGLERGVGAHHAGMLPIMKEIVESLFTRGLVKMVYATETLALGINMPARTVVIESLRKWNGVSHEQLTPGEYTQLSGRAGRRGIDVEGHSVVLHRRSVAPQEVSALASKRMYPLVSAFHPTYNMVVNLLEHSTRAEVRSVLETSFAQFQADGQVVRLASRARQLEAEAESLAADMHCDAGDAREYFALRDRLSRLQKDGARQRSISRQKQAGDVLANVRPGDVIAYRRGRRVYYCVFAFFAEVAAGGRIAQVIGTDAKWHQLLNSDAPGGMSVIGSMRIAGGSALRKNKERVRIAEELRRRIRSGSFTAIKSPTPDTDDSVREMERQIRQHPVHRCGSRDIHAKAGYAWARVNREHQALMSSIESQTNSVAKEFDRVCHVLEDLGFLNGDAVTDKGHQLRRVFGERALIMMEAVAAGAWDRLSAPELAAIVSTCVYESRFDDASSMAVPKGVSGSLRDAWDLTLQAMSAIHAAEKRVGATKTPDVDTGLMGAILAWANGSSLGTALESSNMQGGDFVRWIRQVMDALDQLRHVGNPLVSDCALKARSALMHGVVSWSNM